MQNLWRGKRKGGRKVKTNPLKPIRYSIVYTYVTTRKRTMPRFQLCRERHCLTTKRPKKHRRVYNTHQPLLFYFLIVFIFVKKKLNCYPFKLIITKKP